MGYWFVEIDLATCLETQGCCGESSDRIFNARKGHRVEKCPVGETARFGGETYSNTAKELGTGAKELICD